MKALDADKYHELLVAFSAIRPEHHTKDPTIFDKLNDAMKESAPSQFVGLAKKLLPDGDAKNQLLVFISNLSARLPKLTDILADPTGAPVPFDPHFQYVVASAITKTIIYGHHVDMKVIMTTAARLEPAAAQNVVADLAQNYMVPRPEDEEVVVAFAKYLARLEPDIANMAAWDIAHGRPEFAELPELKALQITDFEGNEI